MPARLDPPTARADPPSRLLAREAPSERATLFAIALSIGVVFAIDAATPRGFAIWAFYLIPLALSVRVRRPELPLQLAAIITLLLLVGYLVSAPGLAAPILAIANRVFMTVTMWVTAWLCRSIAIAALREGAHAWTQTGEAAVARAFIGDRSTVETADALLAALAPYVGATVGALYLRDAGRLARFGAFAVDDHAPTVDEIDGGVAAQVARDGRPVVLRELPASHLSIRTTLGASTPGTVVIAPLSADGRVIGVVELGFVSAPPDEARVLSLLAEVADRIGTGLGSARLREREQALLERTREQADTLQRQQGELRAYTAELEAQSRALQDSQAQLETQQAELEQTNAELEAQAESLERERAALADAQRRLGDYASKLEAESRYKSEFLANMSHELRTPLNSALILAKLLADNRKGNLDDEQIRWSRTILAANNDLLTLINDILDLSKIESGHVDVERATVPIGELLESMRATFDAVAAERGVGFEQRVERGVPATIVTDPMRVSQILRNFLSNAFKFTERGRVSLIVRPLDAARIAIDVVDTGIGIAPEQHALVFDAFRQADGTTSRRYGGTGLGLTISRELAQLLGGEIALDSAPGRGSRFTLTLPVDPPDAHGDGAPAQRDAAAPPRSSSAGVGASMQASSWRPRAAAHAPDEGVAARNAGATRVGVADADTDAARGRIVAVLSGSGDADDADPTAVDDSGVASTQRRILVVEDDRAFGDLVEGVVAEAGFDAVRAGSAAEAMRRLRRQDIAAVLLDIGLPDESGLSLLERLKRDPSTRHLPIHVLSGSDHRQTAFGLGAAGYALKPVQRDTLVETLARLRERIEHRVRRVLVIEDDARLRDSIVSLLSGDGVSVQAAGTLAEATALVEAEPPDCIVLDLVLPDGSGYDFLERNAAAGAFAAPPTIVYTGRSITADEEQRLRRYSSSIIVKGARSPERLLDEVTLFLHQVESELPASKRRMLEHARARDARLDGRRILLAEDDARNVFALASSLEPLGVELIVARNGRDAIQRLEQRRDVDLVLMDVMMPELDGLSATRLIRERPEWAKLPIIALTAKAMPEDRAACLKAGANDYVSKPIDIERLVSLMRVWLPA